jgi:hypothetical protein
MRKVESDRGELEFKMREEMGHFVVEVGGCLGKLRGNKGLKLGLSLKPEGCVKPTPQCIG